MRDRARGDRALPAVLIAAAALVGIVLAAFRPAEPPADPHSVRDAAGSTGAWTPAPRPEGESASLTIDFGNGARRTFDAVAWRQGMTVGDLMEALRDFRPGIRYDKQREGEMAFLTSLEGVANDPEGGRYWMYAINGADAEMSFAVQPLKPGDAVLWQFRRAE